MKSRAIITSCSDKYFPSLINLLTSIKVNYPNHPPIYVYDLGLFYTFRKELEQIEGVKVISMPHFCPHWRSCYTWKTYIFAHPLADLNFYLDAGCQVLRPFDEDFETIDKNDYLALDIGVSLDDLIPSEYKNIFSVPETHGRLAGVSAGIFGFKNTEQINQILIKVYDAAKAGLALGFSPDNLWRNKRKDKNIFIRICKFFRHDQSLLNLFLRLHFGNSLIVLSHDNYDSVSKSKLPTQKIWHCRLQARTIEYSQIDLLHPDSKFNLNFHINRALIYLAWKIKNFKNT